MTTAPDPRAPLVGSMPSHERVLASAGECGWAPAPGTPHRNIGHPRRRPVRVCVSDRGPGFGRLPRPLRPFVRGRSESSQPGVGLGLSICRAIVEAHGGTIEIERSGGLAAVVFTLPAGLSPPIEDEPLPEGNTMSDLAPRVVIVGMKARSAASSGKPWKTKAARCSRRRPASRG